MSRFTGSPHPRERASAAALSTSELLEALWGRGQEMARQAGASPSQLRALRVIGSHEGTNLRRLAECLGSRAPSVSRLCDRLEALGLAERCPSVTSRREVEIRLTSRGRTVVERYPAARMREFAAVLAYMEPAAVAHLAAGLEAFHAAASSPLADEGDGPLLVGGHARVSDSA